MIEISTSPQLHYIAKFEDYFWTFSLTVKVNLFWRLRSDFLWQYTQIWRIYTGTFFSKKHWFHMKFNET